MWITGQVVDELGRVLSGVTIEASSPTAVSKRLVSTDACGQYVIQDLRPGVYTLRFARPGFTTVERRTVDWPGLVATINAQLSGNEPAAAV